VVLATTIGPEIVISIAVATVAGDARSRTAAGGALSNKRGSLRADQYALSGVSVLR
jgi:hypothetical protein